MRQQQTGATLIVVLIFLLAITVIGTLAIRQSMVGLNIATNSQVSQLVMQNSDATFFNIEEADQLIQSLGTNGMFGYISGANDKNKELVFCFRGDQTSFFDLNRASLMIWEDGAKKPTNNSLGSDGYCDAVNTSGNWFTSGRKTVMTQVAVKFSTATQNGAFYGRQRGTDETTGQIEVAKLVKVFAVSLMPSLTNVDRSEINTCLQEHMSELTIPDGTTAPVIDENAVAVKDNPLKNVTECLTSLNVPFTTQVSEYNITQNFS